MEPIRIVLAEDHSLVREGTRRILEQSADLTVVGDAGDGQQALELVQRLQPDVAILDIRMPKLNGIEVVRRMKECSPRTKALMLTAYDDDDYILALMEAGASGYLLKTARADELVEAVRSVHQGEPVLHPAIAAKVARLWGHRQAVVEREQSEQLSPREREVLGLAAKGLRNKAIADKLNISVRTVEGHFNSILTKLGVSSRIEAVLFAASRHWVTLEEEATHERD
ncbi:MAG: response regulator transcription factor [Chloroflexi bacterium]|nr:response regulator transcription factor [Chloroflexota bacterium]